MDRRKSRFREIFRRGQSVKLQNKEISIIMKIDKKSNIVRVPLTKKQSTI